MSFETWDEIIEKILMIELRGIISQNPERKIPIDELIKKE
jgi:hypothetical protein